MQTNWQRTHRKELRIYKAMWRKANPEKVKAQKARSYQRQKEKVKARASERYHRLKHDPKFKHQRREQLKNWRKNNWEHFLKDSRERARKYRQQYPDRYRAYGAAKYQKIKCDPARYRHFLERGRAQQRKPAAIEIKRRYRSRRRGATGSHTYAEWIARVEYHGWCCFYCHKRLTRTTLVQEHRIPLSKGGTDFASNLVPACQSCNAKKHAKHPCGK